MSFLVNPSIFGSLQMGPGPSIRGSSLVATGNVSTYNFPFPAGAVAGDLLIGFMAHGWDMTSVGAGQGTWTIDENKTGTSINGTIWHKILVAADITRGFVTLVWSNAYFGQVGCVCFAGAPTGIRTFATVRNPTSVSSETVTTGSSPAIGDYAIMFGESRANLAVTVDGSPGTALNSLSSNEASGVSRIGTLLVAGALSETYLFSSPTVNGDYSGIIIVQP